MKKTISLGKVDGYGNGRRSCELEVTLEIEKTERPKRCHMTLEMLPPGQTVVSISGGVWNHMKTDYIYCGQIYNDLPFKYRRLAKLWRRWHLNDMKSGTAAQDTILDAVRKTGWKYDYSEACEILKEVDLFEDRGFPYGHGWLLEVVPDEVVAEMMEIFGVVS